jgi:hypothetical protein
LGTSWGETVAVMTRVAVTVLVALTLLGLVVVLLVGELTAARTRGWLDRFEREQQEKQREW